MNKEEIREKIVNYSSGLIAATTDLILFGLTLSLMPVKGYGAPAMRRHVEEVSEEIASLGIDRETVKRSFWKLSHRKYIKRGKGGTVQITEEGESKLSQVVPAYSVKRQWDGIIYLLTYDIPENYSRGRHKLYLFLKNNGYGMLQESVWVSLFDPKETIKRFIKDNDIRGSVIISSLGKDGGIGDEDLDDLLSRIYQLEELNVRYQELIDQIRHKNVSRKEVVFSFLSILKDDPQLPFELLPYNWMGDKCYRIVCRIERSTS